MKVIGRTRGRIARNETNTALGEVADEVPGNGVVWREKPDGIDVTSISYVDSVTSKISKLYLASDVAEQWVAKPELGTMMRMLGYLSGAPITRTMATGINPSFALANVPRDLAYIWLTTPN